MVGGGGRGEKVMAMMEGREKGRLFFTDNVLRCQKEFEAGTEYKI